MRAADPISDEPLHTEPRGYVPPEDQRRRLLLELSTAGVELGDYDLRIVDWMSRWTWSEVATVASWIRRAGGAS